MLLNKLLVVQIIFTLSYTSVMYLMQKGKIYTFVSFIFSASMFFVKA